MKKTSLMAIIAITIFASCQKDETDSTLKVEHPEINSFVLELVEVSSSKDQHNESVLSFRTEADMYTQIQNLQTMSETESEQWYSKFDGYVSQHQFMWNVVEEIDKVQSLEELKAIHDKHAGLLVFNDNEADMDVSPYVPSTHLGNDIVCNKHGNVMINGEIHNYNNVASYSELQSPLTKSLPFNYKQIGNSIAVKTGASRLFVRAYYVSTPQIFVWLESQRKSWFGFNKYRTKYRLRMEECRGWDHHTILAQGPKDAGPENWYTTPKMRSSEYNTIVVGLAPSKWPDPFGRTAKFVLWVKNDRLTAFEALTVVWNEKI